MEKKKKNIILVAISAIFGFFGKIIMGIILGVLIILAHIFIRCKVKGKGNVTEDEGRVFISNHYELFGPISTMLFFPYKCRPWIIDKMLDAEKVEEQMGLLIYREYKKVPMWLKKIALKIVKNFMIFTLKLYKGIPVSRDNFRKNLSSLELSAKLMSEGKPIMIWPEKYYVKEGVGPFMSGFEHLAKYYYQKTGKCLTFYPLFTSFKNKTIYIGKPIKFDPKADTQTEKLRLVNGIRNQMVDMYFETEVLRDFKKNFH